MLIILFLILNLNSYFSVIIFYTLKIRDRRYLSEIGDSWSYIFRMTESRATFSLPSPESTSTLPETDENKLPEKPNSQVQPVFAHRFRYFILFLGCLCLTSISSNMIVFNFTLICFHKPSDSESILKLHGLNNSIDGFTVQTDVKHINDHPTYDFTQHEKSMLMWAVAVGSIIGTFPFNYFYAHFGARYVFFGAGMLSAFSTLLIPTAAEWGFGWFLTARVIQGIAYSADFAAIGVLCARWASLKQAGMFVSILTCFSPLSSSITNPAAGIVSVLTYLTVRNSRIDSYKQNNSYPSLSLLIWRGKFRLIYMWIRHNMT